jgi:hypothetical protein
LSFLEQLAYAPLHIGLGTTPKQSPRKFAQSLQVYLAPQSVAMPCELFLASSQKASQQIQQSALSSNAHEWPSIRVNTAKSNNPVDFKNGCVGCSQWRSLKDIDKPPRKTSFCQKSDLIY